MSNQVCPHCGKEVPAGLRFCTGCGMPIRTSGQTGQNTATARPATPASAKPWDIPASKPEAKPWDIPAGQSTWTAPQSAPAWQTGAEQSSAQQTQPTAPAASAAKTPRFGTSAAAAAPVVAAAQTQSSSDAAQQSVCPACGKPVAPGSAFCPGCGASLEGGQKPKPKSMLPIYLGVGVAALAVIVVGLLLILGGKNKANSKPSETSELTLDYGDEQTQPSESGFGTGTALPDEPATESETETEPTTEPGLTLDEARALVSETYGCDTELLVENTTGYDLQCLLSGHELGTVRVDKDGTLTVLSGMTGSNIHELDLDVINGYFSGKVSSGNFGYAIVDLHTGEMVGENMDTAMSSSVIIDVPILYAVAQELENGSIAMDSAVPVVAGKSARGSLSQYKGSTLSVSTMLDKMFGDSSGDAACSLMDYIGMDRINQICHDAGYPSVQVRNYIGKSGIDYTDRDNVVSAGDVCGMLDALYNGDNAYINADFLENNMHMRNSQDYSNNGLGKNISHGLRGYFNGIKSDKYNEVILVNDDNGHVFAICYLGCHTDDGTLMNIAKNVGSYVNDVMCR